MEKTRCSKCREESKKIIKGLCRSCYNKLYHKENIDKFRIFDKNRYEKRRKEKKIYTKEYYKKHPEKYKYDKDYSLEYNKNNKYKRKSQYQANRLIKIPKNQLCKDCNLEIATEKHHEDYNKPLEVIFLCSSCHKIRHSKRKMENKTQ